MRLHFLAIASLLALACASHDGLTGSESDAVVPVQLRATIASVQLLEDCPDPEPARAARQAPADEYAKSTGYAPGPPSCTQSTMQLSLAHDARDAQRIEVVEVRLLSADKKATLATLVSRRPQKWNDNGSYDAWDERIPVGSELKASWSLTPPNWSTVQTALIGTPNDTFDQRYVIEVDLKIAGKTTTVRSAEFSREREEVMVT